MQPANRAKAAMFGEHAPVWVFLNRLEAEEHPERARSAGSGLHLIEVFPALALASLDPGFCGRLRGPRYNPARRRTFRLADWRAVIRAAEREATRLACPPVANWLAGLGQIEAPRKADQDRLDSALCVLIAIRWRLRPRGESVILGDLRSGYMVSPVSREVFAGLSAKAGALGVPLDGP